MTLEEFFKNNPKAALAFSGGVDSSYLLAAGLRYGADLRPYFVKSVFQPQFELNDALALCQKLGLELTIVETDILRAEGVAANGEKRCYHCKSALFQLLRERARADGYALLLDGSNASDDAEQRPGMRALAELGVVSPLRLCALSKDELRCLSKEAGLASWDKPAYACLATRIPAGQSLSAELLGRVDRAENALRHLGFIDFRVRVYHDAARLQFFSQDMHKALSLRQDILDALRPAFNIVLMDLAGR